ncbi:MAG: hypothetical protein LBL96_05660, partial [Clostridiales bacterium]|nr:hypothetical protein [Clostridiales bacterium]
MTFQFVPPLILLLIITALVFTSGPFSPLNPFHLIPTYADSSGVNVPALSLSTSGDVGFVVLASENGRVSSGKITARVTTDSPVGYTLAIASEGMNGGMAGNLTSDSDSTQAITPISGDITAPIVFDANNCNQWGFAVPSVQTGSV